MAILGSNTSGHLFDTSFTTEGVLYSAASGVITSTAAGSAGQVLQSAGNASPPVYTTATFPATATGTGKVLIADGTNWVASTPTFPNASATSGKIIQSDGTNWIASTPTYPTTAGSAGKIHISDGTNIISSTPTYPNSATSTGTILRADGTNWVASTATYPNTAGTSGNVLTSDGTNWVSSAPASSVTVVSSSLTSAQIKALHGTPIQVVAAPGAGKVIHVLAAGVKYNYGGTNVFTAAAGQTVEFFWGTALNIYSLSTVSVAVANAVLTATNSNIVSLGASNYGASSTTPVNAALNLYNPVATEISGNAAGNNTISYYVIYYVGY